MRGLSAIRALVLALYPFLILAGLRYLDARTLGALVLLVLLLRYRSDVMRLIVEMSAFHRAAMALPVVLGALVMATNEEALLRLYPAAVSTSMLCLFGGSLLQPPSMIERLARLQEPGLSAEGVRYTRHVTQAWCVFFVVNGALAVYTALWASREAWALYNGCIAYIAMGCLFLGERLLRQRFRRGA